MAQGYTGLIMEFRHPVLAVQFIPFFLLGALTLASFALRRDRITWQGVVVFLSFCGALTAIRHIPVFAVLAAPFAAERISFFVKERGLGRFNIGLLKAAAMGMLLTLIFWSAGEGLDVSGKYRFGAGDRHKARYAAEFLKWCSLSGFKGPIFNDYDFGGYLIWKLYPLQQVFVDSRALEYDKDFVEKSFYYWKPEVWRELEARYGFTAVIVPNESYYSCQYLDSRSDWVLVYWDDDALVYFKDIKQNEKFIKKCGYRVLKPNCPDQGYLRLGEHSPRVSFEIERSLFFSPASRKAAWMKRFTCGG
jgi:hypothetical protein